MFRMVCAYMADALFAFLGALGVLAFFIGTDRQSSVWFGCSSVVSVAVYGLASYWQDRLLGFSAGCVVMVFLVVFLPVLLHKKRYNGF